MDLRVSKLFVQLSFWAAICQALIFTVVTAINLDAVGWLHFIDPALIIILAVFVRKHSRVATLLLVLYQFMFQIILLPTSGDYLQILWFVFYIVGLIGALRYHKLNIEEAE